MKLVDALDSKSSEPCVRVGSIPTSGTIHDKCFGIFYTPISYIIRLLMVKTVKSLFFIGPGA